MPSFEIEVTEYNSTTGRVAGNPREFTLNDRQLVIGMVRSILTVNSARHARRYMAGIVRPTLRFMLNWDRAPALALDPSFRRSLRDFSVTTRVGELAQGVAYGFWKWSEGYSLITDFHPWASGFAGYAPGGKEPDFAMFNPVTGDVALMEAKGTFTNDHRPQMAKALQQCANGLSLILATRGFGTVLTLDADDPQGQGSLHIRDPETKLTPDRWDRFRLFRRSYASWFDLIGDTPEAERLRMDEGRRYQRLRPHIRIDESSDKFSARLRQDALASETAAALGFDPEHTVFRLDPEIDAALDDIEAFEKINWKRFHGRASADLEHIIAFPDGTSIAQG